MDGSPGCRHRGRSPASGFARKTPHSASCRCAPGVEAPLPAGRHVMAVGGSDSGVPVVPVGHVPNSRQPRFPGGRGTAIATQDPRRRSPTSCAPGSHCARGGDEPGARSGGCRRLLPARRHRPRPAGRGGVHRHGLLQHIPGGALRLRHRRRGCALPGGGEFRDGAGGRARARLRHRGDPLRSAGRIPAALHVRRPRQFPGAGPAAGGIGEAVVGVGNAGRLCRPGRARTAEAEPVRAVRRCRHRRRAYPDR